MTLRSAVIKEAEDTMNITRAPHQMLARLPGIAVLFALLLAACAGPNTPTATTGGTAAPAAAGGGGGDENDCEKVTSDLKIGFDTSLTGGTADLGEGHRKGFKLALKEYNAKGGYQGKKIQCIVLDDGTKPEAGLANTTRLVDQEKVLGLIAYTNTGIAVPGGKQLNDAGVPLIVPVATGTQITAQFTTPGSYVFHLSMADINQVKVMMSWLEKNNWTKPAIMHDVSGYGKLGATDITAALAAKNSKPVEDQTFQIGDTDMTAQLTKAKNAGADVIMTYALAPELANLLKSMDRLGWYPPVVGSWTLAQPDMIKFATPDVVKKFKIYMVQSFTIDRDDAAKAFHAKVEAEYGKGQNLVPITAAQGYDATNLFLAALEKAGTDRKAIRDAIEATDNFKGVTTAPAKPYSPDDHEAIDVGDMFMGTLQEIDGSLKVVKVQ
jgi:branched-chain amino acid transport system substrate-binding protein